jgi:glycopeptide antibiotics resistance protein
VTAPDSPTRRGLYGVAPSPTRAGLSLVLLLYFLGIIGVITLAPFRFTRPQHFDPFVSGGWFDVVANVLLFVPLGFLYPLSRSAEEEPSPLHVWLLGVALSTLIETTQLFEPQRYTSLLDILTNGLGAVVGALLVRAITRRIRVNARLVGRLSLEIPLIGLIYVLVPLLLVASLSALADSVRLLSLIPLGLLGARLISSVQQNHFRPPGLFDDRTMALLAAGWMVLGTFPVLLRHPLIGSTLVVLVALTTWYESSRPTTTGGPERRFEADALRSAVPYIAVYFAALIFLPLAAGVDSWRFEIGLTGSGHDPTEQMLRLLEPVASLTVLGYLLAEARGRRELSFSAVAGRVAAECACVACAIEASRGFQRGVGASGVQFALVVAAGLLGAGMYHNQREHVRWILAHRGDASAVIG